MRVEPQWIDYNGHLNMAYYNVLFDRAVDEVYELIGIGPSYLKRTNHSTFTAEVHVRYLRELRENDPVRVAYQLLDYDAKRIHYFETLLHAEEGWVSATSENMTLHVDMAAKKVAPFSRERAAHAGGDESRARAFACAGRRRAQHQDAGKALVDPPAGRSPPRRCKGFP